MDECESKLAGILPFTNAHNLLKYRPQIHNLTTGAMSMYQDDLFVNEIDAGDDEDELLEEDEDLDFEDEDLEELDFDEEDEPVEAIQVEEDFVDDEGYDISEFDDEDDDFLYDDDDDFDDDDDDDDDDFYEDDDDY